MKILMLGLVLGLVLGGCGSAGFGQHWVGKNAKGQEILTAACPRGGTPTECEAMQPVQITTDPADEEFWQFEARVRVRALVGIPYGRMPRDFNVIGTQGQCESVRATVEQDTPTEPCKGPFYFRRETSK